MSRRLNNTEKDKNKEKKRKEKKIIENNRKYMETSMKSISF